MGFLDKFRPQPEYQHADPAVRVMAVQELPDEAQDLLGAIAQEDTDAGIRRLAAGRLSHVETLATIAHRDQDEGVRAAAAVGLRHLAVEGTGEAVAEAALASLEQPKDLADVAKTAAFESVSLAALGRLTDARAIGTVARRADRSSVRLEALGRIVDPSELGDVALKSDHKDVVLAALDKLWNATVPADREALKAIAVRARNKAAARRAKAMLRTLDEGPGRPSLEEPVSSSCSSVLRWNLLLAPGILIWRPVSLLAPRRSGRSVRRPRAGRTMTISRSASSRRARRCTRVWFVMRTLVPRRNARRGSVRTRWRRGSPRAKPSKGSTATRPCSCSLKPFSLGWADAARARASRG